MTPVHRDAARIRAWMVDHLVAQLGVERSAVDPGSPLVDLGLGSKDSVVLAGELGEFLGRPVSPVEFFEHPTIDQLVAHLTGDPGAADGRSDAAAPAAGRAEEAIAVVGLSCRYAGGADDPDRLWELLTAGRTGIREVPAERWAPWDDGTAEIGAVLARTTRWGGFLDDVAGFDADYFGVGAREAAAMDPQQRLLLEVAHEALERAGIAPEALRRSRTGVFVGACIGDYGHLAASDLTAVDAWSNTGGALSIIANRLSYLLDLRGPSLTVDTACSSSLVAVHLAAQSLRLGESDAALVGGVNLLLSPGVFQGFDASGALSPSGVCRAFDAAADGFVRGEGCGVVVLKRLTDARRDGDEVLAVIRGSAVNQDGLSNGLFAPNPAAQMAVLRSAYAGAGVHPRDVDYVEAHGTGTPLGDPIEARALGNVLGRGRRADAPLLIGSVKGNLGHLEGGAGLAGLIKTVLAMRHGVIPATPHFVAPNPHIPFDQLRLSVVHENRPWPQADRPRRAGVSSFGFGGTNAHVVLEGAPSVPAPAPSSAAGGPTVLTVSAASSSRLRDWAARLAEWFDGAGADVALPAAAAALARRSLREVSASVVARDAAGAAAGLRALAAGEPHPAVTDLRGAEPSEADEPTGTVFVFSGQGAQWAGMGRALLGDEPAFAAAVDGLDPEFTAQVGFSLREALAAGLPLESDDRLQPVLVGLQLALVAALRTHGVVPDAVIGHSVGEVTAAIVAGALTPAQGLRVVAARGRLMAELDGGAVAMLGVTRETAAALIAPHPGVEIAVHAAPAQTGVAGPAAAVDAVIADALARNHFARRVEMRVASHTAQTDPILDRLADALADLTPAKPALPFFSTVEESAAPSTDAAYWTANVRRPVQLHRAVAAAAAQYATFVEVGAHPVLAHAISATLPAGRAVVGTLLRDGDDAVALLRAVAAVRPPRPEPVAGAAGVAARMPTTPWRHRPYWLAGGTVVRPGGASAPGGSDDGVPAAWRYRLDWVPQAAEAQDPKPEDAPAQRWVVVGDGAGATALAAALGAGTPTVPTAEFATPATVPSDAAVAAITSAERVVLASAAVPDPLDPRAGHELFAVGRAVLTALLARGTGRLHLVTRNAQPIAEGDRAAPAPAVLWGLGRTLALEHPQAFGGLLDVDETVPEQVVARYLLTEAGQPGDRSAEDQVVYRAGGRHVPRLRPAGPAPAPAPLDPDGAHLVVGATGNLGPTVLRELVRAGARTVVAVSRNPGDRLDALGAELAAHGARLVTVAADAADETAMATLLRRFGDDLPRLRGIYLAAFGGGPVTLAHMREEDVAAMFRPKLDAAAVLDRLSRGIDLDHFVLFTSISGLTGSRWLGHYAATTTHLDALAFARRAAGLPATAINWGLWRSLHESQDEALRGTTDGSGLVPMDDDTAIRALSQALAPGAPVRSVIVDADWPRLAAAYRVRAALRIVDELDIRTGGTVDTGDTALREQLRAAPPEQRLPILGDAVAAIVAAALGLDSPARLDRGAGFFQAGMDSLTVVTVARTLARAVGEDLPTSVVFDYPSADGLTEHLAGVLPELIEAREQEQAESTDDYDDFSEDELLARLAERLG